MGELAKESRAPGIIMGLGFGGFVDGIVLHQIVQWHNMGSAVLPPTTMEAMKQNMAWDGWFHVATLLLSLIGVYMLLGAARNRAPLPTRAAFTGQLVLGWGIFNLIEGIIDHHLLGIHHVQDIPVHEPSYDLLFLGIGGIAFIVIGLLLSRDGNRVSTPA